MTRAAGTRGAKRARRSGSLRIIGGEWRGRRLTFPPLPGLRPTADRVRETLFNWLRNEIEGARCLDLFAGSGALGLEALSRGAALAVFVDRDRAACDAIRLSLSGLDCDRGEVLCMDATDFLSQPAQPFDIVFLDPPFRSGYVSELCTLLGHRGWLAPNGALYVESESDLDTLTLPVGWHWHREKRAGQVAFRLARRTANG
jgi:16S rRNA (guanine966-N2)-methyltransferase